MRLSSHRSQLLVVDVQEKLAPAIFQNDLIIERLQILLDAAQKLSVPVVFTEHYPARIGRTIDRLRLEDGITIEKTTFSAVGRRDFRDALINNQRDQIIVCGMETHVCVMQTALDLLTATPDAGTAPVVVIVADAVGSRQSFDRDMAISRLREAGAIVTTTEMLLFEWLEDGDHPHFRHILKSIKQLP